MFYYPYMNYYALAWMTYQIYHEEMWFDVKIKEFQKNNSWFFNDSDEEDDIFYDCQSDIIY